MKALEHLVRRTARQIRVGGELALTANGDPALVAAFAELGWADPHLEVDESAVPLETASVRAPEHAVLKSGTPKIV